MGRRSVFALGAAVGTLVAIGLYDRLFRSAARVDLYFEDGSMVSLSGSSQEAGLVLPQAREALRAAQL